ncbi:MAG: hypothetical protein LLF76_03180 [Planctomycetaceae bacterium]|nr:hypothetical protein [Planctomycetaceae bacterium]
MKATVCKVYQDFEAAPAGAILPAYRGDQISSLMMKCPGCGQVSGLQIRPHQDPGNPNSWEMSGWPDEVTLTPSVHHSFGCGWHGWLKNGKWKSV